MVSSTSILVKRDSKSYETSSYSSELDTLLTKSVKVKVSLIVNSFLANGFRYLAITFDALYIWCYILLYIYFNCFLISKSILQIW